MKEEYDIENLNPRKNPYSKRLKKQITINIDNDTIDFLRSKVRNQAFRIKRLSICICRIVRNIRSNYKCLGSRHFV